MFSGLVNYEYNQHVAGTGTGTGTRYQVNVPGTCIYEQHQVDILVHAAVCQGLGLRAARPGDGQGCGVSLGTLVRGM